MSKTNNEFNHKDGVSLKEYFCQRLDDLEEKITVYFDLNKIALDKAEAKLDIRLEGMNQIREQLKEQATQFVTKSELVAWMDKVDMSIKNLELSKAMLEGKASQSSLNISLLISVIGLLIGIFSLLK